MQGMLMPVGGAEDRRAKRIILSHFVDYCGGHDARVVIIPSASSMADELAQEYRRVFSGMGVRELTTLHIMDRAQANTDQTLGLLNDATGIFFTGGDQLRLMALIGATRLADAIHERFQAGTHIAGTSAGASMMSQHMIAFGRSGSVPSQRMVQMASGLGLIEDVIIDQHFTQRNRLGRLLTAIALNPGLTGVGIDEDTALLIAPDGSWSVIGAGSVTVVDSHRLEYNDVYSAKRHDPFTLRGIDVRVMRAT